MDNPAGRLLALFQAARQVNQSASAKAGWAEVFGIEESDTVQFMRDVTLMFELARETRERIEARTEDEPAIILEHFPQVENTLETFLGIHRKMAEFLTTLDPRSGEHSLKLCSSILHRTSPEPIIEPESVDELRRRTEELIEDVLAANDLEADVRTWIIQRLNEIRDALLNLKLHGVPGLEIAKDQLIGGLGGKAGRIASLRNSKVGKKVVALIVAIDIAVNFGANFRQLTAGDPPKPSPIILEIERQICTTQELPALPPASSETEPKVDTE